jgi:hypothetical protein
MELVGSEENQAKADPDRDNGNKRIFKASLSEVDMFNCRDVILSREFGKIWYSVLVRHSDLIVSFRIGPSIHVCWFLRFQAEPIPHHIGY